MLTKSLFMAGCQCPRLMWLMAHRPELGRQASAAGVDRMATGREVGEVARGLFPGGVLVGWGRDGDDDPVETTRTLLGDDDVPAMFEGSFRHDGVLVRTDVLLRRPDDTWDLMEVKSSTRVKSPEHVLDVGVQAHVLRRVGVRFGRLGLLHLNPRYVRGHAGLDPRSLFTLADLTAAVDSVSGAVASRVRSLRGSLARTDVPDANPGPRCRAPRNCPFVDWCLPAPGRFDVSQLPKAVKAFGEITKLGIDDLRDIPPSIRISKVQARVKDCSVSNREYVSAELRHALEDVQWPLLFLDFETATWALPRYVGTKPYQQLPVQWSLHVLARDGGTLEHREFLHGEDTDPRRPFTESLLDAVGTEGSIVVYSSFEKTVLRGLAEHLPELEDRIEGVISRLYDLLPIVRDGYYHPSFRGSFSIKYVLPALVPDLDYSDLEIANGESAAAAYRKMVDPSTPSKVAASIRESLLRYCERDTLAMVKVREALLARVSSTLS